jgi:hypothetical protein
MGIRGMLLGVACLAASMLVGTPANAGTQCVTYGANAPMVGPQGDTECSPDTQFTHYMEVGMCNMNAWPVGECLVFKIHTM